MKKATTVPTEKMCQRCKQVKQAKEFYPTPRKFGLSSLTSYCKACLSTDKDAYWKTAQGKVVRRRVYLKRRHKITLHQFDEMSNFQNHKCLGCGRNTKLYVDHDHRTEKIRGLLCRECNLALGNVKDNVVILLNLIAYLMKHHEFV